MSDLVLITDIMDTLWSRLIKTINETIEITQFRFNWELMKNQMIMNYDQLLRFSAVIGFILMIVRFYKKKAPTRLKSIKIINNENECERVIKKLKSQCVDFPVLGFDCEWVSFLGKRQRVALVQLCSPQGHCALIRLCNFSRIPISLKNLLEDPMIIKAGVEPYRDGQYLEDDYEIDVKGTCDIRFLAERTHYKPEGLKKLAKSVLGIELDGDSQVSWSDWQAGELTTQQVDYAAMDAFVGVQIFRKLYNSIQPNKRNANEIRMMMNSCIDVAWK